MQAVVKINIAWKDRYERTFKNNFVTLSFALCVFRDALCAYIILWPTELEYFKLFMGHKRHLG